MLISGVNTYYKKKEVGFKLIVKQVLGLMFIQNIADILEKIRVNLGL